MFEIDNRIISSEELDERIKQKVYEKNIPMEKEKGNSLRMVNGIDFYAMHRNMASLRSNLIAMNSTWMIAEPEVVTSKPYIGKLIIFVKKVMRKSFRWLFRSYFNQVTTFNGAATRAISDMMKIQETLIDAVESMMDQEENSEN